MTPGDRGHFVEAIEALAATFGVAPTEALITGYWMGLDDLPIESVMRAVRCAMRQSKFMPKAVELRELAGDMPISARAVHAWDAVRRAIAKHGTYRSVDFDDPVINATLRNVGGWQKLCATETEEAEKWTRKDFERIYAALCSSGITEEQAKHLPGAHELDASGKGLEPKPPERVLTGLPPQRDGILRQLSAPERLVLAGRVEPEQDIPRKVANLAALLGGAKAMP